MPLTQPSGALLSNAPASPLVYAGRIVSSGSDIALDTCANGGTKIGDTLTNVPIPTRGLIRTSMTEGTFGNSDGSGTFSISWGLKVGATKSFSPAVGWTSTNEHYPVIISQTQDTSPHGGRAPYTGAYLVKLFDIEALFPTEAGNTRDIEIYLGDVARPGEPANGVLKGVTAPTIFEIEVIDLS